MPTGTVSKYPEGAMRDENVQRVVLDRRLMGNVALTARTGPEVKQGDRHGGYRVEDRPRGRSWTSAGC
jgi:hypothetical protein